jgi:GNAT superfamily N-acetyltransferase
LRVVSFIISQHSYLICAPAFLRRRIGDHIMSQIRYADSVGGLSARQLRLVRREWVNPPSPSLTLASLRAMGAVIVALNDADDVVGFVCGMTDGLLVLYVWDLEVVSDYREQGIGDALLERLLQRYGQLYQVNAHPDARQLPLFERHGFVRYQVSEATAVSKMQMQWQNGGSKLP